MNVSSQSVPLYVAGLDEAGRGTLAGPVTAACVILRPGEVPTGVCDSKKLTPEKREALFPEIIDACISYAIVSVGPRRIESWNIREAALRAMKFAANRTLSRVPGGAQRQFVHLLIDGNAGIATTFSHEPIIKGDQLIPSISAASILAKVHRDRLMQRLNERYPGYGFDNHKGYGTEEHLAALRTMGPSRVHRKTFAGVRELVDGQLSLFNL